MRQHHWRKGSDVSGIDPSSVKVGGGGGGEVKSWRQKKAQDHSGLAINYFSKYVKSLLLSLEGVSQEENNTRPEELVK